MSTLNEDAVEFPKDIWAEVVRAGGEQAHPRFEFLDGLVADRNSTLGDVEAAWQAIRISPYWKEQYEKYLRRMRLPNQAIVVIARKLLVAVWHVLTKEEADLHASEEDLAYKMLVLAWDLDENVRMGLTYAQHAADKQFAKYALMKLGVETDITRFVRKDVPRRLVPREEVLARMTELGLSA